MTDMKAALIALLAGLVFGVGLYVSQMVNPAKVLAFLDVAGDFRAIQPEREERMELGERRLGCHVESTDDTNVGERRTGGVVA